MAPGSRLNDHGIIFRHSSLLLIIALVSVPLFLPMMETSSRPNIVGTQVTPRVEANAIPPFTNGSTASEGRHGRNLLQLPQIPLTEAFSPEVIINVTIFPSYYHLGILIKYVGSTEPFIRDGIQLPRNFSVLSMKDNKADLDINYNVTTSDNQSALLLVFNRSLLPSEIVHVGISGVVRHHRNLGPKNTTIWWQFKEEVAFQQVNARIFPDVTYFNASKTPDKLQVDEDGFLTLTWSIFLSRGFKVTIATYNTARSLNELLLVPSELSAVITTSNQQVAMTIINVALDSVEVTLATPSWLNARLKSVIIAPLTEKTIFLEVNDLSAGTFTGSIILTTNRSKEPLAIDVTLTIQLSSDGTTQLLLWGLGMLVVLLVLSMGGVIAFTYKYLPGDHVLKQKLSALRQKLLDSAKISPEKSLTSQKSTYTHWDDGSFRDAFMQAIQELPINEREFLKYVLSHPGCTQQEVAEALGMSKSTASRITRRLQARNYLKVEKTGMSNALHVNEQSCKRSH